MPALIFDVDGTLAETEKDGHRIAFNRAFAASGVDWRWSVALYGELLKVTGGKERLAHYLDRYQPDFCPKQGVEAFIAALHAAKTAHYAEVVNGGALQPRSGVERLLKAARSADWPLALSTTTTCSNIDALLAAGFGGVSADWFRVIAAGDMVANKKPAPDIYNLACHGLGTKAEQCLAIEDSRNGLLSANGAGIATVITVSEYTADEDFSEAALVLSSLGDRDEPAVILNNPGGLPPFERFGLDQVTQILN